MFPSSQQPVFLGTPALFFAVIRGMFRTILGIEVVLQCTLEVREDKSQRR